MFGKTKRVAALKITDRKAGTEYTNKHAWFLISSSTPAGFPTLAFPNGSILSAVLPVWRPAELLLQTVSRPFDLDLSDINPKLHAFLLYLPSHHIQGVSAFQPFHFS